MVGKTCNLPTSCLCGYKFDIQLNMSYKKASFIYKRHNNLRNLTANMMSEVCKDTEVEPKLTPLSGEELHSRTSSSSNEARVDIRTRGFWKWGQQTFFDLRVFDPNACVIATGPCSSAMLWMNRKTNELTMKESFKSIMVHFHLWCFQSTVVWEESAKSFINL